MSPRLLRGRTERADSSRIRRSTLSQVWTGAAAAVLVATLAAASGGYPPAQHGALILVFALVVLTTVLVADDLQLDRRSLVLVGGLAALAGWALLSTLWSPSAAWPVLEAERVLLYAVAAAAFVLVVTRERVASLTAGIVAGAATVASYALATRLFPGTVGGPYDPSAGYQLSAPIGYWNALGLLLTFGAVLGVGLALHAGAWLRPLAAAGLVPLSVALYFTFSRGAVLALVVGILVLLVLDGRALPGLALVGLAPAAGVLLASRSSALTRAGETLEAAQSQGQRLAWQLAFLTCLGAAAGWVLRRVETRFRVPLPRGRLLAGAAVAGLALFAAAAVVREGGPSVVADRALQSFRQETPASVGSLDRRLLSASGHGRADYWRVAAGMVEREPLLGEGAGSFERHWTQERTAAHNARDAHNLYLETLAELGPVGLALLLVALAAPLTAVRRARCSPLGPAVAAAYVAFTAHAALDWDWELPLLVLVALACGTMLVSDARTVSPVQLTSSLRIAAGIGAAALVAVALVAHVGNGAVAESAAALERGDTRSAAADARRARSWMPWSHEPWQLLGEAQLAEREDAAARRSLGQAARMAPDEWRLWFDLAVVTSGPRAKAAITRARELNPLGDEVRDLDRR